MQNEKVNATIEAQLVENRVKVLQKEENKMLKKIDDARQQAEKMAQTREASDSRYKFMMEFRMK